MLVEVNCETDFVARGDKFRELVADLAMQIAACESVAVVATDDVEPAVVAKETEIEMQKEDIVSKPEAIRWAQQPACGRVGGGCRCLICKRSVSTRISCKHELQQIL